MNNLFNKKIQAYKLVAIICYRKVDFFSADSDRNFQVFRAQKGGGSEDTQSLFSQQQL